MKCFASRYFEAITLISIIWKWNCDGSFWVSVYEKYRSAADFGKLIDQIKLNTGTIRFNYHLNRKGVFFFEIINQKGLVQYGKLVVI